MRTAGLVPPSRVHAHGRPRGRGQGRSLQMLHCFYILGQLNAFEFDNLKTNYPLSACGK